MDRRALPLPPSSSPRRGYRGGAEARRESQGDGRNVSARQRRLGDNIVGGIAFGKTCRFLGIFRILLTPLSCRRVCPPAQGKGGHVHTFVLSANSCELSHHGQKRKWPGVNARTKPEG